MNGLQPVRQTLNLYTDGLFSKCPFPSFDPFKNNCCSHPLIERVTSNWKVLLMDCSTIITISCFAVTFLMGSTVLCSAFFVAAVASGVSAFYMRQFSTLSDLEDTARGLKETKEKFEVIAKDLEKENNRLSASNRELERNNTVFQQSNQNLIQTNVRLNQQVAQLTLQVNQLRESAERIRSEVVRFKDANNHLHTNVRGFDDSLRTLDQQILGSRALCDQIGTHLATQQEGLGQQLAQLGRYLTDLGADNRIHERIQALAELQRQLTVATGQLHATQLQYAVERANFQAIHDSLVLLRNQFDLAIREAAGNLQANNRAFRDNVSALSQERQRLQDLINRHFGGAPATTRA